MGVIGKMEGNEEGRREKKKCKGTRTTGEEGREGERHRGETTKGKL